MNPVSTSFPILPGDWLGMVGGGQLGRMFCHAAQSLGYKVAVLDPVAHCPAGAVADMHIRAAYDDPAGLRSLAGRCRAITTEFENVPASSLDALASQSRVSPSAAAVAIVQDRLQEKAFIQKMGAPVAPHAAIHAPADLQSAPDDLFPGILKAARLGYDGKGQARVRTRAQALEALASFQGAACVLEALLPLDHEISVVLARGFDGRTAVYAPARNEHREGILAVSTVDAQAPATALYRQAAETAQAIAQGLDYFGVLCVEFFVLAGDRLIVNEVAPRPHNSGHYTINACVTSQFEQQARVMAGLPLGSTECLCSSVMLNILGDAWYAGAGDQTREPDWAAVLAVPGAKLHLYGKEQARRGRKMGHVTLLGTTLAQARQAASQVAEALHTPFYD
jgi:5-(carboxyamino)imidazole ribonucleotide synthase